jgi:hypothetical protein
VAQPSRRSRAKEPLVPQSGGPLFDEEKNYAQLKAYCPNVANERNFEDVLKKLTRGAKLAKVGISKVSAKKNIVKMASAFAAFKEPLRAWIRAFRLAAKKKMGAKTSAMCEEQGEVQDEVLDKHWVTIQQGEANSTVHSFHKGDAFGDDVFACLDENERQFVAAYVHLPKKLGEGEEGDEALKLSVNRMLQGLIKATDAVGFTAKVRYCFYIDKCKFYTITDI